VYFTTGVGVTGLLMGVGSGTLTESALSELHEIKKGYNKYGNKIFHDFRINLKKTLHYRGFDLEVEKVLFHSFN